MGMFLALSGVIGAHPNDVKNALAEYAESQGGGFELAGGSTDDPNIGVITRSGPNTTVMYPKEFYDWDAASQCISEKLIKPVFSLHIHDGDLWMFVLFQDGKEIGWFNPIPEYWEELPAEEKEKWKGDPGLIARLVPTVSAEAVAHYLIEWDAEDEDSFKAYPDDEFTIGDCWQMCDFMKRIGLEYPMGDDGEIQGDTFRSWTKSFPPAPTNQPVITPQPQKPWWKLW